MNNAIMVNHEMFYEDNIFPENYDSAQLHKLLLKIGIPPNIYGYSYILRSIELILQNPEYMHYITKGLYIDVAKEFHATPSRVERAIRHAISSAWANGNQEFMTQIFQNCIRPNRRVPSNSVFLSRLYYYITYSQ
ncbi:MAG: sporulation initiation factor Spo0A C-terminal domain-containing protein [Lachnospiraceae bacterium]|nr:sporulation initiation factor Spo0A C-terminal domain-containing protein [Lachnospiraceae bacterium]